MVYNSSTNALQVGRRIHHHRKRHHQEDARKKKESCKVNEPLSRAMQEEQVKSKWQASEKLRQTFCESAGYRAAGTESTPQKAFPAARKASDEQVKNTQGRHTLSSRPIEECIAYTLATLTDRQA